MDEYPKRHRREPFESPEDVAYILETIFDKVPTMIKNIIGVFFSSEAAKNMAKRVAKFKKTHYREWDTGRRGHADDP